MNDRDAAGRQGPTKKTGLSPSGFIESQGCTLALRRGPAKPSDSMSTAATMLLLSLSDVFARLFKLKSHYFLP